MKYKSFRIIQRGLSGRNLKGAAGRNSSFWCMLDCMVNAMHRNEIEEVLNYEGKGRVI
jgi:hypothetical protein